MLLPAGAGQTFFNKDLASLAMRLYFLILKALSLAPETAVRFSLVILDPIPTANTVTPSLAHALDASGTSIWSSALPSVKTMHT